MEYLNSKVNHKDYMFDHIAWGVDVMKRVNSPRVKILYDIYHAQIMDGDIVRNIRDNFQWIGHFHTGGNPGRHEIDDTQELNYRFVMQAIADLGYTGFVSHEYSPSQGHDPIATLEKAIEICDSSQGFKPDSGWRRTGHPRGVQRQRAPRGRCSFTGPAPTRA